MFRQLFDRSADAIFLFDPAKEVFVDCNRAAVGMMGAASKKQLLMVHPEHLSSEFQPDGQRSREKTREVVHQALIQGCYRFEWRARRMDGTEFPVEVLLTPIQTGQHPLMATVYRDISERKRAEKRILELNASLEQRVAQRTAALKESEEKFRALFERSSQGVLLHDENQILEVNPAAVRILRCQSPQDLLGKHPADTSPPLQPNGESSAVLARQHIQQCMTDGSARFDWLSQTAQGQEIPLDVTLTRIEWSGRQVIQALISDISERKRAEAELRASEARLRESETRFSVAFQASPVFISIFRASTEKYVLANDALLNWLSYSREEVLGRTSGELGMWDNLAERDAVWHDLRTRGSIRQRECRWRNRRSELATVLLSAETITLENESHVLSLVLDITQRKNAEVEMLKALTREKELSQLKSNFVSMVSHEFRTPLGIIQSSTELLRDFHTRMQPDQRDEQLESIVRNTRRMAGLMEEVLVLSRLDAGKLIFQPAALDLNAFFRRVVDEVLSATNRRCPIELSLDSSMPAEGQADERLLGHIFVNLLSNGIKYSEAGGVVHLFVTRTGCNIVCVVRDKGIGIPEEDQQHLFQAFHRGSNVGACQGTGLGLLLVKRCVDLHHGTVQIESRIGEGTTVTVKLPVFENRAPLPIPASNHEKDIG